MPWKASSVMEERLRFVARLLDGEAMTEVCREFGISRKTGYKIFERCREHGLEALSDRSGQISGHHQIRIQHEQADFAWSVPLDTRGGARTRLA